MEKKELLNLERIYKYLPECMVLLKSNGDFPLANAKDIALYGNGVRKTIKGGMGSGEVNSSFFINVYDGFKNAGFNILTDDWLDSYDKEYNKNKRKFKKDLKKIAKDKKQPVYIAAMGEVMPEAEYNIKIDVRCETAIYVLSRTSGEAADRKLVKGDVYLTDTEIKDILYLNDHYRKFILVLNTCGVVDLSKLVDIDNILLISGLGVETGKALADVILGKLVPSGHLSATWTNPNDYPKIGDFGTPDDTRYKEGIYVGYRYFDSVGKKALFPFGYGLSYTRFSHEVIDYKLDNTYFLMNVLVKNVGRYNGKHVIQAYVSKPNDHLTQAYKELISFEKTKELRPKESEILKFKIDLYDLASYDEAKEAYVILKGDYVIKVGIHSIGTKNVVVLNFDRDIIVKKVKNLFKKPDFSDYKIPFERDGLTNIPHLKVDSYLFEEETVNYKPKYKILDEIKNLSDDELLKMSMGLFNEEGGLKSIINPGFSVAGSAGETAHIEGLQSITMADGPQGLRLAKDYFKTKDGVKSASGLIPESVKEYMPKLHRFLLWLISPKTSKKNILHQYATAIPIGSAIANSFNKNLAYDIGNLIAQEMEEFKINLWLAPAMNIQRNILCGRNFEYYSEDPYLSGMIAASITKGVQSHKGCGVTIKHFLCNNQEFNRYVNNSIVSERVLREIYLKGFEICIKEAKPRAVMTSYNLVNGIHTSENININEILLRSELKHNGIIMTDWIVRFMQNEYKYKNAEPYKVVKAHSDLFMPGSKEDFIMLKEAFDNGLITRSDLEINASRLYKNILELKK